MAAQGGHVDVIEVLLESEYDIDDVTSVIPQKMTTEQLQENFCLCRKFFTMFADFKHTLLLWNMWIALNRYYFDLLSVIIAFYKRRPAWAFVAVWNDLQSKCCKEWMILRQMLMDSWRDCVELKVYLRHVFLWSVKISWKIKVKSNQGLFLFMRWRPEFQLSSPT